MQLHVHPIRLWQPCYTGCQICGRYTREAIKSGKTSEEAQAMPIPAEFQTWAWREGFTYNIAALYKRATKA